MFETLYKTDRPVELSQAEYYQPRLEVESIAGKATYFVREMHGWYSDSVKKAFHHLSTLNPGEGYETVEEAEKAYQQQLQHRASEGFVHCFSFDPYAAGGILYRRIE